VAYFIFSVAFLVWSGPEDLAYQAFALGIDTAAFLFAICSGLPHFHWIVMAFTVFVLSEALTEYEWWHVVIIAGLAVTALNFSTPPHYDLLITVVAVTGIFSSIAALNLHAWKERLTATAAESEAHLQLAHKAREMERQRIAADFHDGPLQSFIGFQMRLEIIRKLFARDKCAAEEELVQLQDVCRNQVQELRAFVRSMRPVDVDPGALNTSLKRLVEQFTRDSGISVSLVAPDLIEPGDQQTSIELIQIVREALYNIQKHAAATRAAVAIQPVNGTLEVSIEDNGRGFPFSGRYTMEELDLLHLGPGSIKRRVKSVNGQFVLDSKPGQGAALRIRLVI
jgi:two-component system NarL family sensor kinase